MHITSRGDIWYCDLDDALGSEQQYRRPVLVLQADELNQTGPTTIVAPITSQIKHPFMQAHYILDEHCPLHERSMVLTEQIRAVDKQRLQNYVGRLKAKDMLAVEQALRYSLGLRPRAEKENASGPLFNSTPGSQYRNPCCCACALPAPSSFMIPPTTAYAGRITTNYIGTPAISA